MSNKINVGNQTIKDTFYTLIPVYLVLKIFALSNVTKKQNILVQCWSWTKTFIVLCVMVVMNALSLVIKIQNFEVHLYGEIKFTDSLQLTYLLGFAEYIVDLFFVYKKRHSCVKYLQFYANIDKVLGVPNFSRIRVKNQNTALLFIISFVLTSLIDYTAWSNAYGWVAPTLYCMDYIFGFLNALTVLDVVSNVIQIESRVKLFRNYIQEYHASTLAIRVGEETESDSERDKQKVHRLGTLSFNKSYGILSLSKCYVMLMEQVDFINTAYGFRLGAFCLVLLINLTYLTNIAIRTRLGQFMIVYPVINHLATISTVLRTAGYALVFFTLVYHCEQTHKQCCGIIRLIDLTVVGNIIPTEMKTALSELRALMLSRPIKFHGAKFFTLNYPLLVSVASVVVTYSIILLQSMR